MLNCEQASKLVSEARDHDIPLRQRMGLGLHLLVCRACRIVGKQFAFVDQAMQRWSEEGVMKSDISGLPEATREKILDRINQENATA